MFLKLEISILTQFSQICQLSTGVCFKILATQIIKCHNISNIYSRSIIEVVVGGFENLNNLSMNEKFRNFLKCQGYQRRPKNEAKMTYEAKNLTFKLQLFDNKKNS